MSCGNGCGCCPKCGCRATCTCNHSMGFEGETFSYSVAMMEPDSDSGTVQCGPYCGHTDGNGVDIGYVHGMNMRTAKHTG